MENALLIWGILVGVVALLSIAALIGFAPSYNVRPSGSVLSYGEARLIAQNSSCTSQGALKNDYSYNNNSKTWWIGLDVQMQGCSPACVVYENNRTAEINWRCTGLLPQE